MVVVRSEKLTRKEWWHKSYIMAYTPLFGLNTRWLATLHYCSLFKLVADTLVSLLHFLEKLSKWVERENYLSLQNGWYAETLIVLDLIGFVLIG